MKTSIATLSISGSLDEKIAAIAKAGFDSVEMVEQDFISFDQSASDVGKMVRDHGLSIGLYNGFTNFEGRPASQRKQVFDRIEYKFDLMQALGTDLLLVSSTDMVETSGDMNRIAADFHELGERAAKRGLRVGFEARVWGAHISDHLAAWRVVQLADQANVGLVLDSFHTLVGQGDPKTIRDIPGERIFHVQLADAPLLEMDMKFRSRHFRNMPGEGDLPVQDFVRAVAATGYDGAYSLEIFNDQFFGDNPQIISVDGYRSLLFLMDQVQKREPSLSLDVPKMPQRSRANGVEFIEFAANEKGAKTLGDTLGVLGFSPYAQHISKNVTLWRQGDINIVVNTDKKGFAHSAYVMHGTSVCDIGLSVDDAAATIERARTLGADTFTQSHGQGELEIPAIRGIGGSVLHFLDQKSNLSTVWDAEFRKTGAALGTPVGLNRIDHLAQTINHEELLTWTLFYTSIFKLGKTPTVDVLDPGGLVRSRAIQNDDGTLRITLNGAETHRTFAGRFIADTFGSSVQHIAFACNDIFATAAALAENGFQTLPISGNYYNDLATQFDLPAAQIKKLQQANILYDQDENGAYLQLYSRPDSTGFFFEIVERRTGYDGYGARNAPYRIAAQKRLARPAGMPRK